MRYARREPERVYATLAAVQAGEHYACHSRQPDGPRYPLTRMDAAQLEQEREAAPTCRGIPTHYCYTGGGALQVWPQPAEGWQVWRSTDRQLLIQG